MSPEDPIDRLERDVRGLTASYGAVEKEATRHDEQIKGQADDITHLRVDFRAASAQFAQALADVDRHCEERTQRLEAAMKEQTDALTKKIEAEVKKVETEQAAQKWTTKDRVLVYVALIAAAGTALQAVLP